MRLRNLGLIGAFALALMPRPAQAQSDFIKDNIKSLIEKSGVYVSLSSRSTIDDDVVMGRSLGVGYGTAGSKTTGRKYPISFSSYSGDLQTPGGTDFGQFHARQLMTGIGYQWVHGKMVYSAQLGVGYSFNKVSIVPGTPALFASQPLLSVDVSNSFVVRPQVKAEYFLHRKLSIRTQVSYTYTDPNVVVTTAAGSVSREWRPNHLQFSAALGVFPFRK